MVHFQGRTVKLPGGILDSLRSLSKLFCHVPRITRVGRLYWFNLSPLSLTLNVHPVRNKGLKEADLIKRNHVGLVKPLIALFLVKDGRLTSQYDQMA